MKLSKHGKNISVSVENITPFGIWIYVKDKEYFLSYKEFPYFKKQTMNAIQNVQLLHGYHLYWPELDIDLEIDTLENPEKYPLKSKITKKSSSRRSPFDVPGLRKKITRREILHTVRESRHRAE
jgi:hypothetical protein